jgi:hypothetical protein
MARLIVRKPRVSYFQVPGLTPGVRPSCHTFDAIIRRLRAMPLGEHAIIPTTPGPGGGWESSFGCMAEVDAGGSVSLDLWLPGPIPAGSE